MRRDIHAAKASPSFTNRLDWPTVTSVCPAAIGALNAHGALRTFEAAAPFGDVPPLLFLLGGSGRVAAARHDDHVHRVALADIGEDGAGSGTGVHRCVARHSGPGRAERVALAQVEAELSRTR
ncbi:hypothetical protein [Streptomyces sp. NPDC047071]|uniref:hypothetical protein n=1 Tax=Streptomyces sp. NPDC047071 TaxID=3154808 RepID=UPI003452E681